MPYNPKYFNQAIENKKKRILQMAIPKRNAQAIIDFAEYCFTEGLSERRVLKYIYTLAVIAKWFSKDFGNATRKDVEALVNKIERSGYAEWTKHDYKVAIKKFFKWLRQTEEGYPAEVRWIHTTMRKHRTKLPDEILTQEQAQAMITAATNTRDRALVASLYESGCRIGELLSLQIKHIQPHLHGYQINVNGKKGPRRMLLITCAPYLASWLNEHPKRKDPQAPLWITSDYRARPLQYARVTTILKRIAARASVHRAVNPHNFRHSRATHLATHLTEAQMNEYMGWVQGSNMPATYVHLSGRDIDSALLKLNNIPIEEEKDSQKDFSLKTCPRCSLKNPPSNRFCSRCGIVLDEKAANQLMKRNLEHSQADTIMDRLLRDSEFRTVLEQKLKELNSTELPQ